MYVANVTNETVYIIHSVNLITTTTTTSTTYCDLCYINIMLLCFQAVIKKSKITCKCHGVSGSCSLITCWQQLTSMREIGKHAGSELKTEHNLNPYHHRRLSAREIRRGHAGEAEQARPPAGEGRTVQSADGSRSGVPGGESRLVSSQSAAAVAG